MGGYRALMKESSRRRKLLLAIVAAALLYFIVFTVAVYLVGKSDNSKRADVIIVLGAGLREDGRPGAALFRRTRHAAELWRAGIAPIVLCTGGQTETYPRTEASACRDILLAAGVPAEAILLEEQSHSTEENAIFSRAILVANRLERAVLVSDAGHMLRARWLFGLRGVPVSASPVPVDRIRDPLTVPRGLIREFIAFNWQLFKELFQLPVTHIRGV